MKKSCKTCKVYAEFKEPFHRPDGAIIYGYCFKGARNDCSPNMGKGYPVFIDGGGAACKDYIRDKNKKENEKSEYQDVIQGFN